MAHLCVMSSPGVKGTITGWATAPTTTFDDPDRFRGFRGKRSSPSLRGHCIVCAAQRMVSLTILCSYSYFFHVLFISDIISVFIIFAILPVGIRFPTVQLSLVELQYHGKLFCCVWPRRSVHMGRQR